MASKSTRTRGRDDLAGTVEDANSGCVSMTTGLYMFDPITTSNFSAVVADTSASLGLCSCRDMGQTANQGG